MTYDKQRIARIISDIEKYLSDLQKLEPKQIDDKKTYYAASMLLLTLANRTIDLGDAIVTGGNFGFPSTYRVIFSLLKENGVIDKKMEEELGHIVHYRNLLSHEYAEITTKDVLAFWKSASSISRFMQRVKEFLQKRKVDAAQQ